jgi:hypothetical protein
MDKIKSDRLRELCSLIQIEQNQGKFLSLVQELSRLLGDEYVPPENDPPHHQDCH